MSTSQKTARKTCSLRKTQLLRLGVVRETITLASRLCLKRGKLREDIQTILESGMNDYKARDALGRDSNTVAVGCWVQGGAVLTASLDGKLSLLVSHFNWFSVIPSKSKYFLEQVGQLFSLVPGLLNTREKYVCFHSNWNENICTEDSNIYKKPLSRILLSVSTVVEIN